MTNIIERYVATKYRLQELHVCVLGGYVRILNKN